MENIEKMVQEALDSTKSAHKRIDRMEKRQDNLEELTNAFSVLQNEQEHIKTDVGEIKDDVCTVSQHLSVLLGANLVKSADIGRRVYYSLNKERTDCFLDALCGLMKKDE